MSNEELALLIKAGQRNLLPVLWEQVDRFVWSQANKMAKRLGNRRGVSVEDLYQCGFLALVEAVDTFSEGGKTFAGWLDFYLKLEFAAFGGWRTKRQENDPIFHAASLDAPIDEEDDDGNTLGDLQADPTAEGAFLAVEEQDRLERLRAAIEAALQTLPELQQEVVRTRILRDQTLKDTAAAMGKSMDQVKRIESKAIRALRNPRISRELQRHWE